MKENTILTVGCLLPLLFATLHLTDDILRGWKPGTTRNLILVPIVVVWLYATLVLPRRRPAYVIILFLSLLSLAIPYLHTLGRGVGDGSRVANSSGAFFFIWTLFAVGVTALFSVILSVRGLWNPQRGQSQWSAFAERAWRIATL